MESIVGIIEVGTNTVVGIVCVSSDVHTMVARTRSVLTYK